jgi:hypothetical protein
MGEYYPISIASFKLTPSSSTLAIGGMMEEYPGAGLSLSQLVYALEERLSLITKRSR